jgi:hypothetical protein
MYLLSQHERFGWVCRFLGELIWVAIGIYLGMTSIWIWGFIFMLIDLRGYMNYD